MESEEQEYLQESEETGLINAVIEIEKTNRVQPATILTPEQKFELQIREIPEYEELVKYLNEVILLGYLKTLKCIAKIEFVLKTFKALGDIFGYKYHNNNKIGVYLFSYNENLSIGVHLPRMINNKEYYNEKFVICEHILTLSNNGVLIHKAENISFPGTFSCHFHASSSETIDYCLGNNFLKTVHTLFKNVDISLDKNDINNYTKLVEEIIGYFSVTSEGDDGSIYSSNYKSEFVISNTNTEDKSIQKVLLNTTDQLDRLSYIIVDEIVSKIVSLVLLNGYKKNNFKEIIHIKNNLFTINPTILQTYFRTAVEQYQYFVDKDGIFYHKNSETQSRTPKRRSYFFSINNIDNGVDELNKINDVEGLKNTLIFKNKIFDQILSYYYTNCQNDGLYSKDLENLYFLQSLDNFDLNNYDKRFNDIIYGKKKEEKNKEEIVSNIIPFNLLNNDYFIQSLHSKLFDKVYNSLGTVKYSFLKYTSINYL